MVWCVRVSYRNENSTTRGRRLGPGPRACVLHLMKTGPHDLQSTAVLLYCFLATGRTRQAPPTLLILKY